MPCPGLRSDQHDVIGDLHVSRTSEEMYILSRMDMELDMGWDMGRDK